jgi:hypothetical protein
MMQRYRKGKGTVVAALNTVTFLAVCPSMPSRQLTSLIP